MALELGQGLHVAGMRIIYVTSRWSNGAFSKRLDDLGLPHYQIRLGFISATLTFDCMRMTADQLMHLPKMLFNYWRILTRERPSSIIHTNWHHLLVLWPFLRPHRDIFWLHEVIPDKPRYARLFRILTRRLRCYVVVSQAVSDSLSRIGVPASQIRVIHNGISDPTAGFNTEDRGSTGSDIGIVGQVGAWKGHEDLIEAFAMTVGHHPSARLHIFGDHDREYTRELVELAESRSIAERIIWHGYVSDRSKIYRDIDICVVPSRFEEPFGLTALEASFFGIPVVATRKGGLSEIIIDGTTGYLVAPQVPAQLAERIDQLLESSNLRKLMGAAARMRATQQFSRERFTDDFCRLLSTIHQPEVPRLRTAR